MKTNVQSDIKIPKSGFKRSKLPWSHDINTTFGWGEIQPTECKLLIPGSKTVCSNKGLVRFAPMVAPTFGRVRFKSFSQFVPLEDIWPNFSSMMTQEPRSTAAKTKVASKVLNVRLSELSAWAFMGARATIYWAIATNDGKTAAQNAAEGNYITWYRQDPAASSSQSDFDMMMNAINSDNNAPIFVEESDTFNSSANGVLPSVDSLIFWPKRCGARYLNSHYTDCTIRLSAKHITDLCPVRRDYKPNLYAGELPIESYQREVTLDSCDFLMECQHGTDDNSTYYAIAFEFSDFGKRIRKMIQGLGYQINLTDSTPLSLLPFFAEYKAYFDVFQPQLYQGWETTYCMRFLKHMENNFYDYFNCAPVMKSRLSRYNASEYSLFNVFMLLEFSDQWYIERPDFYAAHIERMAVSPTPSRDNFISVNSQGQFSSSVNVVVESFTDSENVADTQKSGGSYTQTPNIPYINQVNHSYIDALFLQRVTKWINKYSILGRVYDKIMRAFGFGKYLDSIDSKFIGNTDKMLTISDVVSYAATSDASLGEYGGKGLEYFEESKQVFENDVFGYWITLSCIVPEAGYTQNLDSTLACLSKNDFYQADFDAIGMEATTKESLCASQFISSANDSQDSTVHTYGFIPRFSKWKIHKNLVNGDFNRHNLRNVYLPYTLDKQLNVNDFQLANSDYRNPQGALIYNFVRLNKSKRAYDLPIVGIWARTPTKYRWLGHFDRIFLKQDDEVTDVDSVDTSLNQLVGWSDFNRDNFLFHCISDMNCYAPVKPIAESYGLDENDESPTQNGVEYVVKA